MDSERSRSGEASRRASFLDFGGPNSLNNFASSLQRAQAYLEVALPESAGTLDELSPCTSRDSPDTHDSESALIDSAINDGHAAYGSNDQGHNKPAIQKNNLSDFHFPYDGPTDHARSRSMGSVHSRRTRRESSIFTLGAGQSTAPQTIFNAVNTLMGVAMLSLPFAFRLSGWVLGVILLSLSAWVTSFTAKVLGQVLRKHKNIHSYADVAWLYGGRRFLAFATAAFAVDLVGASLSLILIFSDSFALLFPQVAPFYFKLLVTSITLVLSFLPLRVVSLVSLVGILCTIGIFVTILVCGLTAHESPGSLLNPTATQLWPSSFSDLLLSLGIFMAPWGGHPVFPELYRDMRHPQRYNSCCDITFSATIVLDLLLAAVGYAMFGSDAEDSFTKNIIANEEYPAFVRHIICVFLGLLPVCKLALVTRPVISVYEQQLSLVDRQTQAGGNDGLFPKVTIRQGFARVVFMAFLLALSSAFTSFGKVVAFLGSAICFTICMTLPLLFHSKLNAEDLTPFSKFATKAGVVVGILGAILGTYGSLASDA